MNRRDFARAAAGFASFGAIAGTVGLGVAIADDPRNTARAEADAARSPRAETVPDAAPPVATVPAAHDHSHHQSTASSGRYQALAASFADCAGKAAECIGHCQKELAAGDKTLAECLKTALACDTTCNAVARLARLDSDFAPAFAKQAVPVMQACVDACKPHIEHHAVCKACYDACNGAITAANSI